MKTIRFTAADGNATTGPVYLKALAGLRAELLANFGIRNSQVICAATEIADGQFEFTFPAYRMSQIVDIHRDYGMGITAAIVRPAAVA